MRILPDDLSAAGVALASPESPASPRIGSRSRAATGRYLQTQPTEVTGCFAAAGILQRPQSSLFPIIFHLSLDIDSRI